MANDTKPEEKKLTVHDYMAAKAGDGLTSSGFGPVIILVGEDAPSGISNTSHKILRKWGPKAPFTRITVMGADDEVLFGGRIFTKGQRQTLRSEELGWTPEQWKQAHSLGTLTIEPLGEDGRPMGRPNARGTEIPLPRL